jgi:hypothetical protein
VFGYVMENKLENNLLMFFYDKIHLKTMRPNASDGLEPTSLVGSMKFQIMPSSAWLQVVPTPR